jgi:NAD(P)-dependent dehydrogenase (short-subunit alcohol dehydrogenase family)
MGTKQKTVIVTGASQGIGAGVVQAFLNRGYNIVANSRNITKSGAFYRVRPAHSSRWRYR